MSSSSSGEPTRPIWSNPIMRRAGKPPWCFIVPAWLALPHLVCHYDSLIGRFHLGVPNWQWPQPAHGQKHEFEIHMRLDNILS